MNSPAAARSDGVQTAADAADSATDGLTPGFAVPAGLNAVALAFWGWQSGEWLGAACFALAVLLPALTALRLALAERDQHRIADLSTVLFVAIAASFVATRDFSHGLLQAFVWLPGALLPLLLAQTMDVSGRLPLSALFRYLRKQKRRGEDVDDPDVDLSGVYLAVTLVCAGVANRGGPGYYAGVVLLAALALYAARPARWRRCCGWRRSRWRRCWAMGGSSGCRPRRTRSRTGSRSSASAHAFSIPCAAPRASANSAD